MEKFKVKVLVSDRLVCESEVTSVALPGFEGNLTALSGHTDIVVELRIGQLVLDSGSKQDTYFISGGYAEVHAGEMLVLADLVERPDEIDFSRAELAFNRAKDRLDKSDPEMDADRAMSSLLRSQTRMNIARVLGSVAKNN